MLGILLRYTYTMIYLDGFKPRETMAVPQVPRPVHAPPVALPAALAAAAAARRGWLTRRRAESPFDAWMK